MVEQAWKTDISRRKKKTALGTNKASVDWHQASGGNNFASKGTISEKTETWRRRRIDLSRSRTREDGEFIGLSIANLSASVCSPCISTPPKPNRANVPFTFFSRAPDTQHTISLHRASLAPLFARVRSHSRHVGFTFAICICLRPDLLCY